MTKHPYEYTIDNIRFIGEYIIENPDEGDPIYSVISLEVFGLKDIDLMLVIDPRVVHEIEAYLLDDYRWNL